MTDAKAPFDGAEKLSERDLEFIARGVHLHCQHLDSLAEAERKGLRETESKTALKAAERLRGDLVYPVIGHEDPDTVIGPFTLLNRHRAIVYDGLERLARNIKGIRGTVAVLPHWYHEPQAHSGPDYEYIAKVLMPLFSEQAELPIGEQSLPESQDPPPPPASQVGGLKDLAEAEADRVEAGR